MVNKEEAIFVFTDTAPEGSSSDVRRGLSDTLERAAAKGMFTISAHISPSMG